MKKFGIFGAAALLTLAACTSEDYVNESIANGADAPAPMSFVVKTKNITRATQQLETTGHYNFGVWAYKVTGGGSDQAVMENYLVGYQKEGDSGFLGYLGSSETIDGDDVVDNFTHEDNGKSLWFYEGLGSSQYNNTSDSKYYVSGSTAYMSNNSYQYLKYWDKSCTSTTFYAYAPYVNDATPANRVQFNNSTKVMTFPKIEAGYDEASLKEYMIAKTEVVRAPSNGDFTDDVPFAFSRLNGQIRIAIYEEVAGYSITMENLQTGVGIAAKPSKAGSPFTVGKIVKAGTYTYNFSSDAEAWSGYDKFGSNATEYLKFNRPANVDYNEHGADRSGIPTNKTDALANLSSTVYYCVPAGTGENTNDGLTFHMSYTLKAHDTNETIKVSDARVFVAPEYTQWKSNTIYTYVFRITKNSTGTTGTDDPNPDDPEPGSQALYPIVFDGILVQDYTTQNGTWEVAGSPVNPTDLDPSTWN